MAKLIKFNCAILIYITFLHEVDHVLVQRILTKFIHNQLQLVDCNVSVFIQVIFIKCQLECLFLQVYIYNTCIRMYIIASLLQSYLANLEM